MRIKTLALLCAIAVTVGAKTPKNDSVYISTGRYAYAYHLYRDCEGLCRTTASIIKVARKEAKKERKPCRYCYKRERKRRRTCENVNL